MPLIEICAQIENMYHVRLVLFLEHVRHASDASDECAHAAVHLTSVAPTLVHYITVWQVTFVLLLRHGTLCPRCYDFRLTRVRVHNFLSIWRRIKSFQTKDTCYLRWWQQELSTLHCGHEPRFVTIRGWWGVSRSRFMFRWLIHFWWNLLIVIWLDVVDTWMWLAQQLARMWLLAHTHVGIGGSELAVPRPVPCRSPEVRLEYFLLFESPELKVQCPWKLGIEYCVGRWRRRHVADFIAVLQRFNHVHIARQWRSKFVIHQAAFLCLGCIFFVVDDPEGAGLLGRRHWWHGDMLHVGPVSTARCW